jgi:putative ABC transport system substrate-binding protein
VKRRTFIAGIASAAAWPVVAPAQQAALPVVGFASLGSADAFEQTGYVAAFRKGLGEIGYVDGQNVTVEYHWLEGQYDRLPMLMADLVRRGVAVIATPRAAPRVSALLMPVALLAIAFRLRSNSSQCVACPRDIGRRRNDPCVRA